jgi:hypothetical protein
MGLLEWLHSHKEMLQLINSFAPWFSAMGTIAAACVALYLGLRRDRLKLRAAALHKVLIYEGGIRKDYLEIRAVNTGFTKANVTGVDLQWGRYKKKYAVFAKEFDPMLSSKSPIEIEPGQDSKYYYSWELWLSSFTAADQDEDQRLDPRTIKIRVWTSVGRLFNATIPKNHRKELIQAASGMEKGNIDKPKGDNVRP